MIEDGNGACGDEDDVIIPDESFEEDEVTDSEIEDLIEGADDVIEDAGGDSDDSESDDSEEESDAE